MNAMGHDVKNFIGVQMRDLSRTISGLVPDYHAMGSAGMADMGSMEHPMPDNTLPMMTGFGQFGPIEMGGMFTLMKVRDGMARNDYADPGHYEYPNGSVAYEVKTASAPVRAPDTAAKGTPTPARAVPPSAKSNHRSH